MTPRRPLNPTATAGLAAIGLGSLCGGVAQAQVADDFDPRAHLLGDPGGLRSAAEDHGFALDANLTGDHSIVLNGGRAPRATATPPQ